MEYLQERNTLKLTHEEFKELEPFLLQLGVRCRYVIADTTEAEIQAENVYKAYRSFKNCNELAEEALKPENVARYKR